LPLIGLQVVIAPTPRLACVTPWIDNGDILTYTQKNPGADKLKLVGYERIL
jgi:hypothetical protein